MLKFAFREVALVCLLSISSDEELEKILKIIPSRWRFFLTKPLQYTPLSKEFKSFGV